MITPRTIDDISSILTQVTQIGDMSAEAFPDFDTDLVAPVLEEAGKLCMDVLAPFNQPGD